MTSEKQRVVIAEACGWQRCNVNSDNEFYGVNSNGIYTVLPNYLFDLNAMHEVEKVLTGEQVDAYVTTLCLAVQPKPMLHHATAAQRAEAFLRTIGKWEEAT